MPDHREATYTTVEGALLRERIERTMFSICNDEITRGYGLSRRALTVPGTRNPATGA